MISVFPKLRSTIAVIPKGEKLLLLEPEIPDWIVIGKTYYGVMKMMNGENVLEDILAYIRRTFLEESPLLQKQVEHFLETSLLLEHNSVHPCPKAPVLPRYLYLTLTDRCNLKCAYCYAKARKPSTELSLTNWLTIVDKFVDAFGPLTFTFTGGEPLLVEYIFELAAHLQGKNCATILLSNGTLLENQAFANRAAKAFSEIRLSLDSTDETVNGKLRGENVAARVLTAYRNCSEQGKVPLIQCTVCRKNKETLREFADAFDKKCNFQPLFQMGRAAGQTERGLSGEEYFDALKKGGVLISMPGYHQNINRFRHSPYKRCALAIEELSVGPNGDLFPCHMMHYDSLRVGNVLHDDIRALYELSPVIQSLRQLNVDTIEHCKKCVVRNFCGTACRARIGVSGIDPSRHDGFCSFERSSILDALFSSCDKHRVVAPGKEADHERRPLGLQSTASELARPSSCPHASLARTSRPRPNSRPRPLARAPQPPIITKITKW